MTSPNMAFCGEILFLRLLRKTFSVIDLIFLPIDLDLLVPVVVCLVNKF